jgi:LysM repeat protein
MTRETKVGLLVGTGLILLAFIVVGDRLSAQKRQQEQPSPNSPNYANTDLGGSGNPLGLPRSPGPGSGRLENGKGNSGITNGSGDRLFGNNSRNNRNQNDDSNRDNRDENNGANNNNFNYNPRRLELRGQTEDANDGSGNGDTRTPGTAHGGDIANRNATPPNGQNDNNRARNAENPRNPPIPQPKIVKIKAGQTLSDIARLHMGSGSYKNVQKIVKANRTTIRNPDVIREGVEIVIPITHLLNAASPGTSPAGANSITPGRVNGDNENLDRTNIRETPRLPAPRQRTYKVQAGDSLIRIARNKLGGASHWKELHKLNISKVRQPKDLREGMVLVLPSATAP